MSLILHGTQASCLHLRTKLCLQPALVSRAIRGSSPLNLLWVFSLKKMFNFYTDKMDFSLLPPVKEKLKGAWYMYNCV